MPRDGQQIWTPYGSIVAHHAGSWLPQPVCDYLLKSFDLKEVTPTAETTTPMLTFGTAVDTHELHKLESARPFGYAGPSEHIAESTELAAKNAALADIVPSREEVLAASADARDLPPSVSTGRRGR